MDKLVRNIIIVVVVILLLIAAYIAISVVPEQIEQKNIEEIKAQTGTIDVMSTSIEYIKSVEITNQTSIYTLIKNDDGTWGIKEYTEMEFEPISLESAVYDFTNLKAIEEVDLPSDPAEYGFDNPTAKVKIELINDEIREFVLGKQVTGGKGDFFLDTVNNKAYVVSVYMADGLTRNVNSYRKTKLATIYPSDVKRLEINNSNGKMVMELLPSNYTSELAMSMTYPDKAALDENVADSVLSAVGDIMVVDFVDDDPTQLSKYGLLNPSLVLNVETSSDEYSIKFGDKDEKGNIYAMLDGVNFVFTQNTNLYNACVNITPYSLMSKFVNIVNISDVASITVEGKGEKHILEIKSGDEFYIDGKNALDDSFRTVYQSIIGIKGSGLAKNNVSSETEYTIEFVYKNGESSKYEYASYDDLNYYVESNGKRGFITLKKGLDDMMKIVGELAKNPSKIIN